MDNNIVSRIKELMEYYSLNSLSFSKTLGYKSSEKISRLFREENSSSKPSYEILYDISNKFEINTDWLLTGKGEMLKQKIDITKQQPSISSNKLIPFYDDLSSIGGMNERVANMESRQASEWIDAGDWFKEATAAIRHYGNSMNEYPSGCILALKEVNDIRLVIWGKNYVIETDEYRITKRLQRGKVDDEIRAYSSNEETYQDGTLIHEPIDIPMESIRKLALVLGCVIKQESSGMVYNINKNK